MKYLLENNGEGQKDRDKMTVLLSVINKVGLSVPEGLHIILSLLLFKIFLNES